MKHPIAVTLSETDRASLQTFIHAGKATARTFTRARILLKAAEGWTDAQICEALDVNRNTAIRVRRLYLEGSLEAVLHIWSLLLVRLPPTATTTGPSACWQERLSN